MTYDNDNQNQLREWVPTAHICRCEEISEREIRGAIRSGAQSIEEVGRACRAGTVCRGCHDDLEDLLANSGADPQGGEGTTAFRAPSRR